jgi:tryptophan synthase alpha chain
VNRVDKKFREIREEGRKGLVGYLTAGDPDPDVSEKDIRIALEGGVDVLELGVPFSDPTADGSTIQAASQRALAAGMTVRGALDLVERIRRDFDQPIVLFGYTNPFFHYGYEALCADAAGAGADGLLVVDLPFEESGELLPHMNRQGLHFIPLIAPTTPRDRVATIVKNAHGFVYYIMVRGVTGARERVAGDLAAHVKALRECTALPVAVGFGVSSGDQARRAGREADAVVVGSALVKAAREGCLQGLVRELRDALGQSG